jgi:hypothetical protein
VCEDFLLRGGRARELWEGAFKMKIFGAALIAVIAFSVAEVAQAGHQNLCANGGWQTAQTESGGSFSSMQTCVRSRDVWAPTLTAQTSDGLTFTFSGAGFHSNSTGQWYLTNSFTGETLAFEPGTTDAAGRVTLTTTVQRLVCAGEMTFVDGSGVHAGALFTTGPC